MIGVFVKFERHSETLPTVFKFEKQCDRGNFETRELLSQVDERSTVRSPYMHTSHVLERTASDRGRHITISRECLKYLFVSLFLT